jgi:cytoskeleton protein RodZ
MGTFGDTLRQEREFRGITLDAITRDTKISNHHLVALEQEHFNQLPGGVFNKSMVREYARVVGLDQE